MRDLEETRISHRNWSIFNARCLQISIHIFGQYELQNCKYWLTCVFAVSNNFEIIKRTKNNKKKIEIWQILYDIVERNV